MDLNTFLTALYVWIDDWYKDKGWAMMQRHAGAEVKMSDSEVLTLMVAAQWRRGTAWDSERGMLRWMEMNGRGWFPKQLKHSQFNERARNLWGCYHVMAETVGHALGSAQAVYEAVDGMPVPAYSCAQALREQGHWLWESQRGDLPLSIQAKTGMI